MCVHACNCDMDGHGIFLLLLLLLMIILFINTTTSTTTTTICEHVRVLVCAYGGPPVGGLHLKPPKFEHIFELS